MQYRALQRLPFLIAKIQPFFKLTKFFFTFMQIQDFSKHLEGLEKAVQRKLSRDLPRKLGNMAVGMFKENFQRESFFGSAWKEVKRRRAGTKGAAGRRKILTGPTGNLGRSIQFIPREGSVTIESDLPYSAAHNEGTTAGRGNKTTIPQRQFIGEHPDLTAAIEKKITDEIAKTLKK